MAITIGDIEELIKDVKDVMKEYDFEDTEKNYILAVKIVKSRREMISAMLQGSTGILIDLPDIKKN